MLQKMFLHRTGLYWTCVAPDYILADDCKNEEDGEPSLSLREEAGHQGLCYLRVFRYLPYASLYQAQVSSCPDDFYADHPIAFFTEEQLAYALPYDCRLQGKRPGSILRTLAAHGASLLSLLCPRTLTTGDASCTATLTSTMLPLKALAEPIEVNQDELREALIAAAAEQQEETNRLADATQVLQQALLRAALDALMRRLWQTPSQARSLLFQARCKLLALLLRWQQKTRQRIVNAVPRWNEAQGRVMWQLTIGVPVQVGPSL